MRSFDLALDWQIHHVETSVIDLDEVTLKVQLGDGLFSLAPFSGTLSGGTMEGSLEIDVGGLIPTLSMEATIRGLDYEQWVESLGAENLCRGKSIALP